MDHVRSKSEVHHAMFLQEATVGLTTVSNKGGSDLPGSSQQPSDLLTVSIAMAAATPTSLLPAISPWLRSSMMLSLGSSPGSSAGGVPPWTRGPKPQGGLAVRGWKFPVTDKVEIYLALIYYFWREDILAKVRERT
ncbi:uncharacterized protein LOC124648944 [Lolium rigidum]|uniref:uncharacterized protein LOC124648944 n=1 Tax=Lolium rigidum TaxID=89674 RepID=UPI001F5C5635|nr:uncharacterized protein LOC124648944 [Lolium rigidum]